MASRCDSNLSSEVTARGEAILSLTETMLSFGPRPSGSSALVEVRDWLRGVVASHGLELASDGFTASTPTGDVAMENLSYVIAPSPAAQRVVLFAHYESKLFGSFQFLGANDAASSVALLLAITPDLQRLNLPFEIHIVFFDGEESFGPWSSTDGLYGSRHLAQNLAAGKPIVAAIGVDMVGDIDLQLLRSHLSDPALMILLEELLRERGWTNLLESRVSYVEDDHAPLVAMGVSALHLMDFTYGGRASPGSYWHTPEDTMDKLSAESLGKVAEIVLGVVQRLSSR